MTIAKFCSSGGALSRRYRISAISSMDAVESQKGSWDWLPLGVVALNRFVTRAWASFSSFRYTKGL